MGKGPGRYMVITGGLKYGSPTQAQLIVFEMGSQSPTGPWALPSYGHSYKNPPRQDRTVRVVNVDSTLWHAGGIQALDYVIGIPIWVIGEGRRFDSMTCLIQERPRPYQNLPWSGHIPNRMP